MVRAQKSQFTLRFDKRNTRQPMALGMVILHFSGTYSLNAHLIRNRGDFWKGIAMKRWWSESWVSIIERKNYEQGNDNSDSGFYNVFFFGIDIGYTRLGGDIL